jgi:hypothetical protein
LNITNSNKTIKSLEINFNNESGFISAGWNTPVSYTFSTGGVKTIEVCLRYNDGSLWSSHTEILVEKEQVLPASRRNVPVASTSEHSGGTLQIKYATSNLTVNGTDTVCPATFKKTLIIAEGFDPSNVMPGMPKIDLDYFMDPDNKYLSMITDIDLAGYDIVYVDLKDGLDDILKMPNFLSRL